MGSLRDKLLALADNGTTLAARPVRNALALAAARLALEEAARECDRYGTGHTDNVAKRIRALAEGLD